MKLVIDIPKDFYKGIADNKYGVYEGRIFNIIRNGTPLPKELEVLRTELVQMMCVVCNDYNKGCNYGLRRAIQTIDKYKAESEGKNEEKNDKRRSD